MRPSAISPAIPNIGSTTINNHADIIVSNGLFFAAGIGIYGADETVSVNNYGDVSVTGPGTDGIRIFSDFGTVSVRNHGQINASDEDSRGMHLSIFNYRKPANRIDEAVIDLTNYAQITSGTQALEVGVSSFNGAGTVNIDNRGDLITTSEAGKGIEVTTNGETDLDIINSRPQYKAYFPV